MEKVEQMTDNRQTVESLAADIRHLRDQDSVLFRKFESMEASLSEIKVTLAVIQSRLPVQPCTGFVAHLKEHEKNDDRKWDAFLRFALPALSAIGAAIAAAYAYVISTGTRP